MARQKREDELANAKRMLDDLLKQNAASMNLGLASGHTYSIPSSPGQSMTTPALPTPTGNTQQDFALQVEKYIKTPPSWQQIMANALAKMERGRMEDARFLLEFAKEIRLQDAQVQDRFEQLREEINGQAQEHHAAPGPVPGATTDE